MSRDIYLAPILERVAANPHLQVCELTKETGALLVYAARLVDMPAAWLHGDRGMDPDLVETVALVLADAAEAIRAEIENPTPRLRAVEGGAA